MTDLGAIANMGGAIASAVEAYAPPEEVKRARGLARVERRHRDRVIALIDGLEPKAEALQRVNPKHWRKRARLSSSLLGDFAELAGYGVDLGDLQRYREDRDALIELLTGDGDD